MEDNNDVVLDSSPEEVTEVVSEDVTTPAEAAPTKKAEEKVVPFSRFKEVNDELAKLKNQSVQKESKDVDALELIKLGKKLQDYSDEELDFATDHAKSSNPSDILKALENNMVQLAIHANREKMEKEKLSLRPSSTQSDSGKPQSFAEKLAGASLADKEKLLAEAGMYKSPRPRADRVNLGRGK